MGSSPARQEKKTSIKIILFAFLVREGFKNCEKNGRTLTVCGGVIYVSMGGFFRIVKGPMPDFVDFLVDGLDDSVESWAGQELGWG